MNNYLFLVKESQIQGFGAFAIRDIRKGEKICIFRGEKKSFEWFRKQHAKGDTRMSCDQLQVGAHSYMVLEDPYFRINHSCEPNAVITGTRTLLALRNIKKSEEIAYDYSATEWTPKDYPMYYTDGWPMSCQCHSKNCRGKIACFPCLPKPTQKKYLKSGLVQNFILAKASQPKEKTRCLICEAILNK